MKDSLIRLENMTASVMPAKIVPAEVAESSHLPTPCPPTPKSAQDCGRDENSAPQTRSAPALMANPEASGNK
jgi:hypothetical protein